MSTYSPIASSFSSAVAAVVHEFDSVTQEDYILIRDAYSQISAVMPILAAKFEPIPACTPEETDALLAQAIANRESPEAVAEYEDRLRKPPVFASDPREQFSDDFAFNIVTGECAADK